MSDILTGHAVVITIQEWKVSNHPVAYKNNEDVIIEYGFKLGQLGINPKNVELFMVGHRRSEDTEGTYLIAIFDNTKDAFNFSMLYKSENAETLMSST